MKQLKDELGYCERERDQFKQLLLQKPAFQKLDQTVCDLAGMVLSKTSKTFTAQQ